MAAILIGNIDNDIIFRKLILYPIRSRKSVRSALFEIGKENVRYAQYLMSQPKTGKIYKIKGVEHQASAPGEAPAPITWSLYNSLYYNVHGYNEIEFGSKLPYSGYLEDGTEKMEPRPYLSAAIEEKRQENLSTIIQYVRVI